MGIPESKLERIFRAFEQVETGESAPGDEPIKPSGQSIGLGLAVVGRVVHNLGGQLRVDSKVNQGSKFTIILPFTLPSLEEPVEPSRPSSLSRSEHSGSILRIRSDEATGSKQSSQCRTKLPGTTRRGSAGSGGSAGQHSEIDGLVEAIQANTNSPDASSAFRLPFSPNRARLCTIASPSTGRPGTSVEDGQGGSSSSSHSNRASTGATRFEWPPKIKPGGWVGSSRVFQASKNGSFESSTPQPLTQATLRMIDASKVESKVTLSDEAVSNAQASGLVRFMNVNRSPPPKLDMPPPSSPHDLAKKIHSSPQKKLSGSLSAETGTTASGSQGSNHSKLDHISLFTRSHHARVVSKEPMRVMVVEDDPIK